MGDEEMRTEDLISHQYKIIEKKSIKQRIFYTLCFFFGNFNSTQNRSSVLRSSFID